MYKYRCNTQAVDIQLSLFFWIHKVIVSYFVLAISSINNGLHIKRAIIVEVGKWSTMHALGNMRRSRIGRGRGHLMKCRQSNHRYQSAGKWIGNGHVIPVYPSNDVALPDRTSPVSVVAAARSSQLAYCIQVSSSTIAHTVVSMYSTVHGSQALGSCHHKGAGKNLALKLLRR